jgi:hypothetical protein
MRKLDSLEECLLDAFANTDFATLKNAVHVGTFGRFEEAEDSGSFLAQN